MRDQVSSNQLPEHDVMVLCGPAFCCHLFCLCLSVISFFPYRFPGWLAGVIKQLLLLCRKVCIRYSGAAGQPPQPKLLPAAL